MIFVGQTTFSESRGCMGGAPPNRRQNARIPATEAPPKQPACDSASPLHPAILFSPTDKPTDHRHVLQRRGQPCPRSNIHRFNLRCGHMETLMPSSSHGIKARKAVARLAGLQNHRFSRWQGSRNRTYNLRFWRPTLCQLSYTPNARIDYSMILATTPAPTVRPPSRMAKRRTFFHGDGRSA